MEVWRISCILTQGFVNDCLEMRANALRKPHGYRIADLSIFGYFALEVSFKGVAGTTKAARRALTDELVPIRKELESRPFANG